MTEQWAPVPYKNFGDLYEVSSLGRIRSRRTGRLLKPFISNHGYPCIVFCTNNKRTGTRIHPLVAKAFVPNPDGLPIINHADGDKTNNADTNLEWCSPAYNTKHAAMMGRCSRQKLMPHDAQHIRERHGLLTAPEMAILYGVHQDTIRCILRGKSHGAFDSSNKARTALAKGSAR